MRVGAYDKCKSPEAFSETVPDVCPLRSRLFAIGKVHEGPTFTKTSAGACSSVARSPSDPLSYAEIGTEIPATDFAEIPGGG